MKKYSVQIQSKLSQLLMIAGLFLMPLFAHADLNSIEVGPDVGSSLPELDVLDQFSDRQQLDNLAGPKGTIIVLFRSADWCPFCKRHLLELNAEVKAFKKMVEDNRNSVRFVSCR